ncbi:MAG: helix-turn-helix domain-containing protein [Candidatus Dormibacteria bacterium]
MKFPSQDTEYKRNCRRQIAYGRWQPYVDAEPARQHIRVLQAAGIGWKRIAYLAGLSETVVSNLLYGNPPRNRAPAKRVRPATLEKIMMVRVDQVADSALVDATGTRRRLQALMTVGWSQAKLAHRLGKHPQSLSKIFTLSKVTAATARAVHQLFDALWDTHPPQQTCYERGAATKARRLAQRNGWLPPMAWDEETINAPGFVPNVAVLKQKRSGPARLIDLDEVDWLASFGMSQEMIAQRFGVAPESIDRLRYRLKAREMAA